MSRVVFDRSRELSSTSIRTLPPANGYEAQWVTLACGDGHLSQPVEPPVPCVATMGAFDGFHVGHQRLLAQACADANGRGLPCVAIIFDPDPSAVVGEAEEPRLLATRDRARALLSAGADAVLMIAFTRELAGLSPRDFVVEVLRPFLKIASLQVGEGFRFGRYGAGDGATLRLLGAELGFAVAIQPLVSVGGEVVSATRIRGLLGEPGRLDEANGLMRRCHMVCGRIEHGRGEGTSFGFPTANVRCEQGACMPAVGVYGGYVTVAQGRWPAAINVGAPITFSGPDERLIEANLIGFTGDVYGEDAEVHFAKWLRPERKFDSLEELEATVLGNIAWVRDHLTQDAAGEA